MKLLIKSFRKSTSLLLILIFVFCQVGCSNPNKLHSTTQNIADEIVSNDNLLEFDAFTNELFRDLVVSSTITLHSQLHNPENYGIDEYDVTLGSYNMNELDTTSALIDSLNRLKTFDRNQLSESQQITYDELLIYFENELEYSDLYIYFTSLSPTTGIQVSLPIIYAEYSFDCKQDIDNYIILINQTDKYFGEMIAFEKLRSAEGIFMEDSVVDQIIEQCQTFVNSATDGYLITTFNDRLEAFSTLTIEEIVSYQSANSEAVSMHVIPAYTELIEGLTALKGTNRYAGGLCNSPKGKQYYEYLLKSELGWSKSVDELSALLDSYIENSFSEIATALKKDPTALDQLGAFSFQITDPNLILVDLKDQILQDFPTAPDVNYEIKYINKALEKYSSPAMYFTPQIDNITDNVIYINGSNSDVSSLYATLAHEGYPGHMYQSTYFAATNASPIRNLLRPSGYVEGWASYCELYSYSLENSPNPNLNTIMKSNYEAILSIYSKVDIGVNYYGWNEADTGKYLSNYGFTDSNVAHEIYYSTVADPGNYTKYSLGCIAFLELRNTAENSLGNRFNAKDFHKFLMDLGPVQFDIVEDRLKQWILSQY